MGRYNRQRRRYPGLARRAQRQGRIATGPDRRAAGRQIGHIRSQTDRATGRIQRQGQSAARSARKSTGKQAAFERGISLKGTGPDKAFYRNQLQVGAKSVERYGKGLAASALKGARLDARDVREAAQEDIYNTRESVRGIEHQATAEALAGLVGRRRETQAAAIADQQAKTLDQIQAQRGRQRDRLHDALDLVGDAYVKATEAKKPPSSGQDWSHFTDALSRLNPNVSPRQINAAVEQFRARQRRQVVGQWARMLGIR